MLFMSRVSSWFRKARLPLMSTNVEIREEQEKPWRAEQMAFWTGNQFHRDPNHDPLTAENWEQRRRYRLMLAEPTVKAAFLGKVGSVASQELRCNPPPGKGDDPWAKTIADFIQSNLIGPGGASFDLIWPIASGMLIEGFSVCEKIMDFAECGPFKGKWILDKLKAKDTRFIQLETDRFRNITGLYNNRGGQGATPFDPKDFVIASYLSFFADPHGMSDFRSSYRAVELIVKALQLRTQVLNKNIGPYLAGKISDKRLRARMEAELKLARADGYIVLDKDMELEVLDLASRGTSEFQSAIDDLRKEIAIGIQGAFLQMLEGMGTDNRGSADVQKDTSEIFAWILSIIVTGVINRQIIPEMVWANFGPDAPIPICQLGAVNPADVLAELRIDELLINIGVDLSKADLLMRANRKGPRDESDKVAGRTAQTMVAAPSALATPFSETTPAPVAITTAAEGSPAVTEDVKKKALSLLPPNCLPTA